MSIEIRQGDSFAYDLKREDDLPLDATWSGKWAVLPDFGGVPLCSGVLVLSADETALQLRIAPATTASIPVGTYKIIAQVTNLSLDYNKEVFVHTFYVKAQGIPG